MASKTGKTLSNATLSLRFMQNAQRAKMQAQVEAEQAKIRDEAEWEVSKEVKEAWGISSISGSDRSVTHETSYVPFLFSSEGVAAGPSRVRGRRTFNHGEETIPKEKNDATDAEKKAPADTAEPPLSTKRPTSISGFKVPVSTTQMGSKKARKKTVQMLIHETPAVQLPFSLPATPETASAPAPLTTGFMKPAGIDDPIAGPGSAPAALKRQREQDPIRDHSGMGSAKRKKSTNVS
ncbi:hypothetical protein SCP_1001990 [Sparassis crispa]|uniref:Uncharacterized protein n=1 Tax=Sparassis crispa TaxID=139825 RepID=A0A401GXJ8_9APHY|nr:hypothetical protein SCP_1001990 [Sparassis crispa]GBE86955.1 hypothetical protein SCP_1001990 [Sparassis crispa]